MSEVEITLVTPAMKNGSLLILKIRKHFENSNTKIFEIFLVWYGEFTNSMVDR